MAIKVPMIDWSPKAIDISTSTVITVAQRATLLGLEYLKKKLVRVYNARRLILSSSEM